MCVAEVGGQDAEITQGWAFLTPRCRYRAHGLSTALPLHLWDRGCRGSMHVGSDVPVGAVEAEMLRWGRAGVFDPETLIQSERTRY